MIRRMLIACSLALAAAAAWAHGPTPQKVEAKVEIKADAKTVWAVAGDFAGVSKWDSAIKSSEGDHKKRTLTFANGEKIVEEVDEYDPTKMTYSYRMLDPNVKAIPASSYSATLTVTAGANGSTQVEWSGHVYRGDTNNDPPENMGDQAAKDALGKIFQTGLDGIKAKVESKS